MSENKSKQTETEEAMGFEEAMKRLDALCTALESENVSLADSMKLYEEGVRLVRHAQKTLENTERQVKILQVGEDGEVTEQDFPQFVNTPGEGE